MGCWRKTDADYVLASIPNGHLEHAKSGRLGVAAINSNAEHCDVTERAASLPKQWSYSVIAPVTHLAAGWLGVRL